MITMMITMTMMTTTMMVMLMTWMTIIMTMMTMMCFSFFAGTHGLPGYTWVTPGLYGLHTDPGYTRV